MRFYFFMVCTAPKRMPKKIRDPIPHLAAFPSKMLNAVSSASRKIREMSVTHADVRGCRVFMRCSLCCIGYMKTYPH